jgi:dihydrofolate reductase
MGIGRFQQSISVDGFSAGPDQSEENPLGVGGEALHDWMMGLEIWRQTHGEEGGEVNESTPIAEQLQTGYGAMVMGRNMFGPIRGDWGDESWTGWWGEEPPYHVPVYVLTHHPRESIEMKGDTTFHFVTDGVESAFARAREAAGDQDVLVAGGASAIRQALSAGLVDEFTLSVNPMVLGAGERPLDGIGDLKLEQLRAVEAPGATHLTYRVVR